jgi:hypothetical protein
MKKEFCTYKPALALRELGFDEPCLAWYHPNEGFYLRVEGENINSKLIKKSCTAPLYQQAFRWFREKYDLDSFVKPVYKSTIKVGYYFGIDKYKGVEFQTDFDAWYNTYEEAESACLDKLIEIVKNK